MIAATAGAATAVLVVGCAYAATSSSGSGHETIANVSNNTPVTSTHQVKTKAKVAAPVAPLKVVSVTPAGGARGENGAAPITVKFSSALSPQTPLPKLSPSVKGSWQVSGDTATFTPATGFLADTTVKVTVPGGADGMLPATSAAGTLKQASVTSFTTGSYSTLRLQQLLTQLGYLPLTWTPSDPTTGTIADSDANGQLGAAYDPPAGTFTFKSGYPSELTRHWSAGSDNILVNGAVRAFENNQGITMDGDAGPQVWGDLLSAVAKDKTNPNGYSYALATQGSSNESLEVWHDGKKVLTTAANTGIPASPTQDGTFPVYLKYTVTQMKGLNPDGTKYDDTVYWASYFNGGDAVHAFPRPSYGSYQSLGCVELPYNGAGSGVAENAYDYLSYGSLVTVTGAVA
ncbi:MAG TPA: Ig-like domain-containing protein [Trebonia sp.]|nr:Ig-like domain-containing protein [Trebonia sp.]